MIIYELRRCEEYWMRQSAGLFTSRASAIKAVDSVMLQVNRKGYDTILISYEGDHHSHPTSEKIITRAGVEVTLQNVEHYLHSFEFYELEHSGYGVWGIYPREVQP